MLGEGDGTIWGCSACLSSFPDYDLYLAHGCLETHATKTVYGCSTCLQNFLTEAGLANHTCDAIRAFSFKREDISMAYETKDSGERQEFSTGMVRDTTAGKVRYDLVYMPMFKRWAELMTRGAVKYSANNWKKASTQEELDRFKESAFRHFMTWFLDEDRTEDHGAAIFFNVAGAEYVKDRIQGAK